LGEEKHSSSDRIRIQKDICGRWGEAMFDAETDHVLPITHSTELSSGVYHRFGKRLFDILFTITVLPIIVITIIFLAIIIKLDGGTIFFGHNRLGKDGKYFKCWKLRTMVQNAEEILQIELEKDPLTKEIWEKNYKLNNDPRITKIGKILRKLSLDELPQFWNVLVGEMSVVGPRPVTVKEIALYGKKIETIHMIRPGVTGLWQISGRNDTSYDERVKLDIKYAKNINFQNDIKIIINTIWIVFTGNGK